MRQRFALPNLPPWGELAEAADSKEGSVNPSGRIAPILSMARRVSRPPQRAGAPFIWNMGSSHPVLAGEARSFRTGGRWRRSEIGLEKVQSHERRLSL